MKSLLVLVLLLTGIITIDVGTVKWAAYSYVPYPTATPTPLPLPTITVIQFADPDPGATTCNHPDVQDAFIAEEQPTLPWGHCWSLPGATVKLYVGNLAPVPAYPGGRHYYSLIKFLDLSSIPRNAIVDSAVLSIKQTWCQTAYADGSVPAGCSGRPMKIAAHWVTSSWAEDEVTWDSRPTFSAVALSSQTITNTLGSELRLNITAAFRAWLGGMAPNYGVILLPSPYIANDFWRGRSHDTVCDSQGCWNQGSPPGADAPKLIVTWRMP